MFRTSSAPVQVAVRWAETQGYGIALGSASTQSNARGLLQSVSRFVPELLAKRVVVIEQEEQGDKPVSIYNHLWIQALPSTMQTDIVTFLSATRRHFLFKDLVALASTLLATRDADFWIRLAASNLLFIQHGEFNYQSLLLEQNGALDQNLALVEEYNSLPSWLEEYKGSEWVLFFGLSPRVGEPQVPAEVANNNRVENVVHIGGGDQEELSTSQTNSQSKRKHGEAELEGIFLRFEKIKHQKTLERRISRSMQMRIQQGWFLVMLSLQEPRASHVGLPSKIDMLSNALNLSVVLSVVKPWLVLTQVLLPKLITMLEPPSRMLGVAVLEAGKAIHELL